jgi:hypothetical protein
MDDKIFTFLISVLTAGATAVITYFVSISTNLRNKELELKREQAFKYFLPLKFIADELYHRLAHIEKKIIDKTDADIQLPQSLDNKSLEWYFIDWKNYKNPKEGAGGYFLVTTIFMHCQLYNRINGLLTEYPFLEVETNKSLINYINLSSDEQLKRCYNSVIKDEHTRRWINLEEMARWEGKIKLERLIKCVRLSAVMKGGIPYGLQTAFGQFIETNKNGKNEQINYEEFVRILMDKEQRVKFQPLISFYSEIIDKNFEVEAMKLIKLRALMVSLLLFRNSEIA